jgi:hypothetical protein
MNFQKKKKCAKRFTWRIIEDWRRGGNGRKRSMMATHPPQRKKHLENNYKFCFQNPLSPPHRPKWGLNWVTQNGFSLISALVGVGSHRPQPSTF